MDIIQLEVLSEELKKIGVLKKVQSHQTLVQFGEKANKLYFIQSGGLVLLHVHPITGNERAINFFIPDFHPLATVSESFTFNQPSKYHLKSFTNTSLIEIKKSDFEQYLATSDYSAEIQAYGIKTLLDKNELRALLISLSSEEMLQYLHEHYPQILQQIPSKYVANFLGITPQWLSKLKHKL